MPLNPDSLLTVNSEPPIGLSPWINSTQSLTQQLKAQTGDARLQVLRQAWSHPNWWDKHTLHITEDSVLHREILMHAHLYTCWYARTVIPHQSYNNNTQFFNRLEHEPLTTLIFNNSSVKRSSFIRYPVTPDTSEYHWLNNEMHHNHTLLWARLAEYTVNEKDAFYLLEVLLPDLLEAVA
ncbi:chorismate--pyruvate lyase family protein [Legionella yabuuchiae]|uniref:chorismate--pyruvate lyase family protein n=1 Tax=Legionella yabuuchiae TaxID=376727 RepID=UPI001054F2E5|nr:chorismate lyase [Legionella yabuuchiae]